MQVRSGGHSFHSDALWRSFGSFGFVRLIRVPPGGRWVHSVHPGGRCVHSGSFSSFWCALDVVRFRLVYSGALWGSLGSIGKIGCPLGVVGFIRVHSFVQVRPGGR